MPDERAEIYRQRPEVQRTEIGPVFHDIAHKAYDQVETEIASGDMRIRPVNKFGDLHFFSSDIALRLGFMIEPVVNEPAFRFRYAGVLKESIASGVSGPHVPITVDVSGAIEDGLMSGVVATMRLVETVLAAEKVFHEGLDEKFGVLYRSHIEDIACDPAEIADLVDADHFGTMLHQLAYAENGFLGDASSTTRRQGVMDCFISRQPAEIFDFTEDGKVAGFTEVFLKNKNELLRYRAQRRTNEPGLHSGGCPVRHADFPSTGWRAQGYLEDVNKDGRPYHEGESAITRGARLVAFALRHVGNQGAA